MIVIQVLDKKRIFTFVVLFKWTDLRKKEEEKTALECPYLIPLDSLRRIIIMQYNDACKWQRMI